LRNLCIAQVKLNQHFIIIVSFTFCDFPLFRFGFQQRKVDPQKGHADKPLFSFLPCIPEPNIALLPEIPGECEW